MIWGPDVQLEPDSKKSLVVPMLALLREVSIPIGTLKEKGVRHLSEIEVRPLILIQEEVCPKLYIRGEGGRPR